VIDRVQRASGNVGRIVVVMPGVFVQRLAAVVCRKAIVLVFGGTAGSEIDADPRQRAKRRKYERDERERRDDATPIDTREAPATGRVASTRWHALRISAHGLQMIRIPVQPITVQGTLPARRFGADELGMSAILDG